MPPAPAVYLKTASLCLFVSCLALALNQSLAGALPDRSLRWAVVLSVIQTIAFVAGGVYVLAQRLWRRFRTGIERQISPAMEERVMALALSGETWSTPVPSRGPARLVLEQCVARALARLKDSGRDRLAHFAVECGFARQWEQAAASGTPPQRKRALSLLGPIAKVSRGSCLRTALRDQDPAIRVEAARALLLAGDPGSADEVFRSVLLESRLVRALLCSDLKRHARHLLDDAIPSVLAGNDRRAVANCLEILVAWKLAMPTLKLAGVLRSHPAAGTLKFLLALLPYVPAPEGVEDLLRGALQGENEDVQCAAAQTIGQLKLEALGPALLLQTQNPSILYIMCFSPFSNFHYCESSLFP